MQGIINGLLVVVIGAVMLTLFDKMLGVTHRGKSSEELPFLTAVAHTVMYGLWGAAIFIAVRAS